MRPIAATLAALLLPLCATATEIDIPWQKTVLDNGLTVIVHEDRKAPIVAINIWYHVGSKNEVRGRTGFAHLFEHLMFQGSEHHDDEYLTVLEDIGASDFNATTWFDRTNYFQTVPRNALDSILWLESDRMGHFLGAISQEKLDEQRGVVQNEKRQGDNQPYGRVWEHMLPALFPQEHPYSWETIGSMDDLDAATLDDVREWFKAYYGPNNAVLVIAGDIGAEEAFAKARQYFGELAPVPPITRPGTWVPRLAEERLITMQDRVPQARLYQAWTGPSWGTADARHLGLAAAVLAGDRNSRLYQRLVYRDRLASDVSLETLALEMAGITELVVSAQPGVELATIEAAVQEELDAFFRKGPTRKELERVSTRFRAGFLRGIERVGGYSGKAGILAESMTLGGNPDAWKADVAALDSARPEELRLAAREWLGGPSVKLHVLPYEELAASGNAADRSALPSPGPVPDAVFPAIERSVLANGLRIQLVPRAGTGLVQAALVLEGGFAADPVQQPGTARFAMAMLDEGTRSRSSLQISEQLALLGASLSASASLDNMVVGLSALRDQLAPSLDIFADVVLNASFPEADTERLRDISLASLRQEKNQPNGMALRVLPQLLYGEGHPYARPLSGSGTEAAIQSISRADLAAFRDAWFRPNHATLVVSGDTTMAELRPMVERLFGGWEAGDVPEHAIPPARSAAADDLLYILDRPGAGQSVIFAGQVMPPKANADEQAIQAMNNILGGQVSARINMNLREDKHWSYGAYSVLRDARGERPFFAYAPVQTDKTAEALVELRNELRGIATTRPPTAAELERVQGTELRQLPARWETAAAITAALSESVRFGLPDDYWATYGERIRSVSAAEVARVASEYLQPSRQVFVVVGDRARIEASLSKLGFAGLHAIDADGDPD